MGGKCDPGQYRCHKPSECRGVAKKGSKSKNDKSKSQGGQTTGKQGDLKKRMKVAAALLGTSNADDTSVSSDE